MKKRAIIFASGTVQGGGSGCQNLIEAIETGLLDVKLECIISNHSNGGVAQIAKSHHQKFWHFDRVFRLNPEESANTYRHLIIDNQADLVILSGWNLIIPYGCYDPAKTINVHPGLLPQFGGEGKFGDIVHQSALNAYLLNNEQITAVTFHFVTHEIDGGPIFFQYPLKVRDTDSVETLRERAKAIEHAYYPWAANLVVQGEIGWDGRNVNSFKIPDWYRFHKLPKNY